mmetsp:Transcript_65981/g.170612  ORF Transcript_65981/g.170612 Transcript_65981/m.170612 type:complete len:435 (+) Transcript_65981:1003-2307(+)
MASTTAPSLFASSGISSEMRCRPHQRLLLKAGPSMNLKRLSGSHSQGISCDQSVTNWRCCSTGWSPGCTQTDNTRKGEDRTWAPSADLDGLRKASSLGRQTKPSVTTPGRQTSASQSSGPRSRSCFASSQDSSLSPSESKPKTSLTTALAFTNRSCHCPSQAIAASAESAASKMRSASLPASVSRSSTRVAAATARASRPVQAPRSQEQTPAAARAVAAGAEADPFEEEGMASPPARERTGSEAFACALRKEAARASSSVSGQGDSTSMSNAYPGSWKKASCMDCAASSQNGSKSSIGNALLQSRVRPRHPPTGEELLAAAREAEELPSREEGCTAEEVAKRGAGNLAPRMASATSTEAVASFALPLSIAPLHTSCCPPAGRANCWFAWIPSAEQLKSCRCFASPPCTSKHFSGCRAQRMLPSAPGVTMNCMLG